MSKKFKFYKVRTMTTFKNENDTKGRFFSIFSTGLFHGFTLEEAKEKAIVTVKEYLVKEVLKEGLVADIKVTKVETWSVDYVIVNNK